MMIDQQEPHLSAVDIEELQVRIPGDASLPTLIYLPGLHGDWTLVTSFRLAVAGRVRFVEFTYPRTLTWSLDDYAAAIKSCLLEHGITRGWLLGESFGSQIIWPLLARNDTGFTADGIILAGGFVKHPFKSGVCLAGRLCGNIPLVWLTRFLFFYARFARFRHRQRDRDAGQHPGVHRPANGTGQTSRHPPASLAGGKRSTPRRSAAHRAGLLPPKV